MLKLKTFFALPKVLWPIDYVNIDSTLISEEFPCIKKVLSILSATKLWRVTSSCALLPKMSGYLNFLYDTKNMSSTIKDEKLLTKYYEVRIKS